MNKVVLRKELENLLKNPNFLIELINSESLESIKEIFERHGVSITTDEIYSIFSSVDEFINLNKDGKLDDVALENISGGFVLSATAMTIISAVLFGLGILGNGAGQVMKMEANAMKQEAAAIKDQMNILELQRDLEIAQRKKELERYKVDQMINLGTMTMSMSAVLLLLDYYKDDIYKFWKSKKNTWFKGIKGNENTNSK